MNKEIEKAKEDLSFFNEGDYITKEMEHSARVLEEYIKQLEKVKEDYYWKGYLQKQSEDVEICNLCKYRKKTKTLDKVTYKLKEDILRTKEEIKYWEERYRNAKESNKKSFYRQINRCQSKFETLREILKIIEGGKE